MKIGTFNIPNIGKILQNLITGLASAIAELSEAVTSLQNQVATIEKWKGGYPNLVALETAYPIGEAGWSAHVDGGEGEDVVTYIWDVSDEKWVLQKGTGTIETASSIKTKYESNADTNAFTDNEKSKLNGVENGADKTITSISNAPYVNDITDASYFGYVHVVGEVYTMARTEWSNIKSKLKTYFDQFYQPVNLKFTNVAANTANWVVDTTYAGYGYKCDLTLAGVTATMIAEIILGHAQAVSGNYSPICESGSGIVTIYSKVNATITIPTILVFKS